MKHEIYWWAVFIAVFNPLCLRAAGDPLWFTVGQMAMCLIFVALADARERQA